MPTPDSVDAIPALVERAGRASQTKHLTTEGSQPAGRSKHFQQELRSASTPEELYEAINSLRGRPDMSVNRWAFRPELDPDLCWPRRKTHMTEHARRWLMVDVDSLEVPGLDFAREPERGAEFARAMLPPEFHHAVCVWKASGSAGTKSGIRVHLWFLLSAPLVGGQCRYWLRDSPVDLTLYNPIQVHYTADPILDGVPDPMSARIGRLDGAERVQVPSDVQDFEPPPDRDPADASDLAPRPRRYSDVDEPDLERDDILGELRGLRDGRVDAANTTGYRFGREEAALAWNEREEPHEALARSLELAADIVDALSGQSGARTEKYEAEAKGGIHDGFCHAWAEFHESARPKPPIEFITGAALAAPQPPRKWVSKELGIGPGRPTLFVGYGASCKTFAAQALGLAVASRTSIWGFDATGGNVVHIDAEMGSYSIIDRYQRLARGAGLSPEQWQTLRLASHAGVRLDEKKSEDQLDQIVETTGAEVVILDSLRALTPSLDENNSEIRTALDLLARLSDKHGCTFIVVHHSGKSERADARQVARGSSAIFDAADCVIQFDAATNGKVRVSQTKSPLRNFTPFTIALQDVYDDPMDTALSLSVVDDTDVTRDRLVADKEKICAFVRSNPGCSQAKVRTEVGLNHKRVKDVLELLCEDGKILNAGTKQSGSYSIAPDHGDDFYEPDEVTQVRVRSRRNAS